MIAYEQAKQIVQHAAAGRTLQTEFVALSSISGRVCAADITAPLDIQPFDNAAMDGFALRHADIAAASAAHPVRLKKAYLVAAGDPVPTKQVPPQACVRIMTGAPLPADVDSVVPFELVQTDGDDVVFSAPATAHANVRFAGEDFRKGDTVITKGMALTTAHIMPLATLGIHQVQVFKRPRAIFIATGCELVDNLETPLQPGQIYNSNRPYSLAMLEALGVDCVAAYTLPDQPASFSDTLTEALAKHNPELIISSGAVSAGDFDFVRATLENLGAEILFHKVKMKPGKPNLFARLKNGALYFGLPGNPVATAVGLRFFVEPALRAMMHREAEQPLMVKSAGLFHKKPGLHMFLKARWSGSNQGEMTADLFEGQASFMVNPFTQMNGWVAVAEEAERIDVGNLVAFYPARPEAF